MKIYGEREICIISIWRERSIWVDEDIWRERFILGDDDIWWDIDMNGWWYMERDEWMDIFGERERETYINIWRYRFVKVFAANGSIYAFPKYMKCINYFSSSFFEKFWHWIEEKTFYIL